MQSTEQQCHCFNIPRGDWGSQPGRLLGLQSSPAAMVDYVTNEILNILIYLHYNKFFNFFLFFVSLFSFLFLLHSRIKSSFVSFWSSNSPFLVAEHFILKRKSFVGITPNLVWWKTFWSTLFREITLIIISWLTFFLIHFFNFSQFRQSLSHCFIKHFNNDWYKTSCSKLLCF